MGKIVILAVAGAGKTYTICHTIDPKKRNLIIAYTHQNIRNIRNELINAFGQIPERTIIMTFHSFVNQYFLCPYESIILKSFGITGFKKTGITTKEPPPIWIGKSYNFAYKKDSTFAHYVCGKQYYCDYLSKLIIKSDLQSPKNMLFQRAIAGINTFFECILIDEFQDFREYDFELLVKLMKSHDNIIAVGDFYQHSVSAQNNTGKPFKAKKRDIPYAEYIDMLKSLHLEVDTISLSRTRRCPQTVCNFVKEKLGILIDADNKNSGTIQFLGSTDKVKDVLEDSNVIKLVYKESKNYNFRCINWGYSKGDTYSSACIILTDSFSNINKDRFVLPSDSDITRNKLYVALTRTKGDLYLIKKADFDKVKNKYLIDRKESF